MSDRKEDLIKFFGKKRPFTSFDGLTEANDRPNINSLAEAYRKLYNIPEDAVVSSKIERRDDGLYLNLIFQVWSKDEEE